MVTTTKTANKSKILLLALVAISVRCLFNYMPSSIIMEFPLAGLMQDEHGNWVYPSMSLPYYVFFLMIYVAFCSVWYMCADVYEDAKIEFKVLFWAEFAAMLDFVLRCGQDIFWFGFDMNTVKVIAFAASIPANLLIKHYGGSRIKS